VSLHKTSPEGTGIQNTVLGRRFLHLTGINILANLTVPLAGLVDVAMLGHLDEIRYLAGVALGGALFDFLFWSLAILRMGTTGITAQALGRGDRGEVERILQRSLLLALGLAVLLLLLKRPLEELGFTFLGGALEVEEAGREYFRARIWGAPAVLANLVFLGWFLGREESAVVLRMTLAASLGNLALDYLFIVHLDLAARGAGMATALSQYLMLGVAIAAYRSRSRRVAWNWRQTLDPVPLKGMLRLQANLLIRTLCLVSTFAIFTNASALLGTTILATNTLLLRLLTFSAFFVDGASFAIEVLAGQLHGSGQRQELRRLLLFALAFGQGAAVLFALFLVSAPRALLGLLTSHTPVIEWGLALIPWLVATVLLGASAYILDGYFLGLAAGRTLKRAMVASVLGVFAPLVTLAVVLEDPHLLWFALAAFTLARTLLLGRQV